MSTEIKQSPIIAYYLQRLKDVGLTEENNRRQVFNADGRPKRYLYSATKKTRIGWRYLTFVLMEHKNSMLKGKRRISLIPGSDIEYRENIRIPKAE